MLKTSTRRSIFLNIEAKPADLLVKPADLLPHFANRGFYGIEPPDQRIAKLVDPLQDSFDSWLRERLIIHLGRHYIRDSPIPRPR